MEYIYFERIKLGTILLPLLYYFTTILFFVHSNILITTSVWYDDISDGGERKCARVWEIRPSRRTRQRHRRAARRCTSCYTCSLIRRVIKTINMTVSTSMNLVSREMHSIGVFLSDLFVIGSSHYVSLRLQLKAVSLINTSGSRRRPLKQIPAWLLCST